MLETNRIRPAVGDQFRLVGDTLRRTLSQPTTLLYPILKALLAVGMVLLLGVILLAPLAAGVPLGPPTALMVAVASVVLVYVLVPILAMFLNVAYCYELRKLAQGSRPTPGSGLVFAVERLPVVSLGAIAVSGTFLAGYVADIDEFCVGSSVLGTLLAPALVAEDGSVGAIIRHIDSVAADQWERSVLAVYSVRTLSRVLSTVTIASAVGVVVGHWLGVVPMIQTMSQALFLAVALFVGGFAFATFCTSLVDGPVGAAH